MEIFLKGFLWPVAAFFIFGEMVAFQIYRLNKLRFSFWKTIWFCLFFAVSYVIFLGAKIIFLVAAGTWLSHRLFLIPPQILSLIFLASTLVFWSYFLAKWYIAKKELPSTLISFIPAFFLIYFRGRISENFFSSLPFIWAGVAVAIIVLTALAGILFQKPNSSSKRESFGFSPPKIYSLDKKTVFIGLDGCDWELLNRFIGKGALPNLKKLIASGVLAKCETIKPTESPLVWNSILTGKPPSEHGIVYWYKTKLPFLPPLTGDFIYPRSSRAGEIIERLLNYKIVKRVPFSTQDRRVKAVWNILTDYGKSSLNAGWIFSWPAEEIKGVQVSWYLYPFEEASPDNFKRLASSRLAQRAYPGELTEDLSRMIVRRKDLTRDELERMHFPTEDFDSKKPFAHKLNLWDYAKDKTFLKISHYLLEKQKEWDFFSLYLYGIDAACHTYWPFFETATNNQKYKDEILSVSESRQFKLESANFAKIIQSYYEYIDFEIGCLLDKAGKDCNIVIVSDHGFNFDGTVHGQAPSGVFIASGPYIRKAGISEISIYEILPVLLTLLGLPQAEDMPAKAPRQIFSDSFLNEFSLRFIASYESSGNNLKSDVQLDEVTRKGLEERLKSLGYID